MEVSEQEKANFVTLVERFTNYSIRNTNPKGFCFSTSFVLSIYLQSQNIGNSIVEGNMNNAPHFWIRLMEYEDLIIDATIRQYDESQPQIYIGKKSENDITKEYITVVSSFNEMVQMYSNWCNPKRDQYDEPRPTNLTRKLVLNNLINASILFFEIEKLNTSDKFNIVSSPLLKLYINPILRGLKSEWINDEKLIGEIKKLVGQEFDVLLSKII